MTPRRILLVAGLVLLTVTGCQSGTASSGAPGSASVHTAPSSGSAAGAPSETVNPTTAPAHGTGRPAPTAAVPPPDAATSPVPAGQVETAGTPTNPPQAVQTADGGRTVVFTVEQSGCQQLGAEVTGETPTSVAITVVTTIANRSGQLCPMIVRVVRVAATLSAPLGTRKIVFTGITKHG